MKNYQAIIIYNDNKQQCIALHDTEKEAFKWARNILKKETIKEIILQQIAVIQTAKFQKNEENNKDN